MKQIVLASLVVWPLFATAPTPRFDSPGMTPMHAEVAAGRIESDSTDEGEIVEEVRSQLYYLVGQRFGDASPGLNHDFRVEIGRREGRRVSYRASFLWAWDNGKAPAKYIATLPARGDADGLDAFTKKYAAKCGGEGDGFPWYDFMPTAHDCPLAKAPLPDDAVSLEIALSPMTPTQGKAPPYEKLWEGGRLKISFVAGNTSVRRASDEAAGLFRLLEQKFGKPVKSEDIKFAEATLHAGEFKTAAGQLAVDAFGITDGNVQSVGEAFVARYRESARTANVVAYNGHAGHGANVQAFTALTDLDPSRFYLVWINACNPFVYLDEPLFESGARVHVMTIAHVGWFAGGSDIAVLAGDLVEKKKTYKEILKGLHQSGVVLGEER